GLAFVAAARGQLQRAAELASDALDRAGSWRLSEVPQGCGTHLALAWVNLHRGGLDQAAADVDRATDLARTRESLPWRILCGVLEAHVRAARGGREASEGIRLLRSVQQDIRGLRGAPFYKALTLGLEARLLLARGDSLEQMTGSLDRDGFPGRLEVAVVAARLLLRSARPEEA